MIVLVATCKRFHDRHRSIREQLNKAGLTAHFIEQFEPEDIDEPIINSQRNGLELSHAKLSNLLKQMWGQFALATHEDAELGLLLEDDAILSDDFRDVLERIIIRCNELEPKWLLSLGGYDDRRDASACKPFYLICEQELTTAEAYLFDKSGAKARVDWFSENGIIASNDHSLKQGSNECNIKQYMVVNPLVYQGSVSGRFVTTMDGSRSGKPPLFLYVRFRWNAFRKRILPSLLARVWTGNK